MGHCRWQAHNIWVLLLHSFPAISFTPNINLPNKSMVPGIAKHTNTQKQGISDEINLFWGSNDISVISQYCGH